MDIVERLIVLIQILKTSQVADGDVVSSMIFISFFTFAYFLLYNLTYAWVQTLFELSSYFTVVHDILFCCYYFSAWPDWVLVQVWEWRNVRAVCTCKFSYLYSFVFGQRVKSFTTEVHNFYKNLKIFLNQNQDIKDEQLVSSTTHVEPTVTIEEKSVLVVKTEETTEEVRESILWKNQF